MWVPYLSNNDLYNVIYNISINKLLIAKRFHEYGTDPGMTQKRLWKNLIMWCKPQNVALNPPNFGAQNRPSEKGINKWAIFSFLVFSRIFFVKA